MSHIITSIFLLTPSVKFAVYCDIFVAGLHIVQMPCDGVLFTIYQFIGHTWVIKIHLDPIVLMSFTNILQYRFGAVSLLYSAINMHMHSIFWLCYLSTYTESSYTPGQISRRISPKAPLISITIFYCLFGIRECTKALGTSKVITFKPCFASSTFVI